MEKTPSIARRKQLYRKFIRQATSQGQQRVLKEMELLGLTFEDCEREFYRGVKKRK